MSAFRSTSSWPVLALVLAAAAPAAAQTVEEMVVTGQRASQQKAIDAISGSTPAGDTYNDDDDERVDVKASYAINDHFQVFVEGQNLTDTKLRQYIGPQRDFVTNDERLRRTFYAGVSAKW